MLIWREPQSDAEALVLLRLVGAMECRQLVNPVLMIWLASQDLRTVLRWFTAYGAARSRGDLEGEHEFAHAFDFLGYVHPQLMPAFKLMFP